MAITAATAERITGGHAWRWITCVVLASLAADAHALRWDVTPRISVGETYSDNIALDPPGEEDWDLVTEIRPGVDISGEGRRTSIDLSYSLQALFHARDGDRDRVYHQFAGASSSELVRRTVFFDASARHRQGVDDLLGPIGADNITDTGNVRDVTTLSLSPYVLNRVGSFAESTLRYSHDRTWFEDGESTYSNTGTWRLADGPSFDRFSWSLSAMYQEIEAGERDTGTFATGSLRLGYALGRHWQVSATGGYEDNDYESAREDLSDTFWDVGVRWTPSRRTSMEARYGERYFGNTRMFSLSHRRRFTVASVSYSELITTSSQTVLLPIGEVPIYDPGCPPTVAGCEPVGEVILFTDEEVNEFFLDQRLTGSVTVTGNRQSVTLAGFRSEREFEVREQEETRTGASLSYRYRLGAGTRLQAGAGWSRNEFERVDRDDDLYNASLQLVRDIGRTLQGRVRVRHQRRDSNEPAAEYRENSATVSLTATF